jgi:CyaY protein
MNDSGFNDLVDATFDSIEDALESLDLDIDFDQGEGVLTIECTDGSMVILSRQLAVQEIWVAAKSGGYHLSLVNDVWMCTKTGEALHPLLGRVLTEQLGQSVNL